MKPSVALTIVSLLAVFLAVLHWADDVARGMAPGGMGSLLGTAIIVAWLYGIVGLAGRRSGLVITCLGSLFGAAMPILHMRGAGLAGSIAPSGGALLFTFTALALNVTATFAFVLAARELMRSGRAERA